MNPCSPEGTPKQHSTGISPWTTATWSVTIVAAFVYYTSLRRSRRRRSMLLSLWDIVEKGGTCAAILILS